jgi:hypothetical protein
MQFNLPAKVNSFDKSSISILNQILEYIERRLRNEPKQVTFATNMNTDVAGDKREIVYCNTDDKLYVCTTTGNAGSAVWSPLN